MMTFAKRCGFEQRSITAAGAALPFDKLKVVSEVERRLGPRRLFLR
jgi:hypothetical protein